MKKIKVKPGLSRKNLKYDIPAGLVVFFVAVPLCMGIALASNAPLFSGLIAGIIGGLVIPIISKSELSVSGPAAGLIAVVIMGIQDLGSFEAFLTALLIAGILQILMGVIKAGTIAYFFPSSVIKGMLAGIGIIIIIEQLPFVLGFDSKGFAPGDFFSWSEPGNYMQLFKPFESVETGGLIIGSVSLLLMVIWKQTPLRKINWLPSGLVVVILGTLLNYLFTKVYPDLQLGNSHLVNISGIDTAGDLIKEIRFPDLTALLNSKTYILGVTIAVIASLETLLCIEAVDKIDPLKRKTPMNRELYAQGVGNMLSGLIGGLPITSVIVRSGANVSAGGRSRMAAVVHGLFLLISVVFFIDILNLVPLASLAAILIMVGYELASPRLFQTMFKTGKIRFLPFVITVIAITITNLLTGILIGLGVSIFFVLKSNFESAYFYKQVPEHKDTLHIILSENVTFMNKAGIRKLLEEIEESDETEFIIDAEQSVHIDYDVIEMLYNFQETAKNINIKYEIRGIDINRAYHNPKVKIAELKRKH